MDTLLIVEVKLRERTVHVQRFAEVAVPDFVTALNEAGYPARAG